ncbi:MAG: Uma2 family endonuclease [Acetobacteraceae bacterium]|nr:Uma2 family endonuclease [Acetobacteraceae bacterium]
MCASLRPLTLEEFLDWERTQPARYEFDGIQPIAMTGGSVAHARLVAALGAGLPPGCEAFGGDLKVLTTGRARYPDATVVCGPLDTAGDTVEPVLVAEVLSPSTALTDRRVKAAEYASVASVQVYVMLDQEVARATVLRRAAGWREELVEGRDAVLALPEAGVRIALAALYA